MIERGDLLPSDIIAKICAVLVCLLPAGAALAQSTFDERSRLQDDRTNTGAFAGSSGQVVVKEFTETGKIEARGTVTVSATTIRNASSGVETKGVTFAIRTAALPRDFAGFLAYEEIEDLLQGIDYLAKLGLETIRLANFEAVYRSRGDLRIVVLNSEATGGRNLVSIELARGPDAKVDFRMEDLGRLRSYIAAAKDILDNPNSATAKGARAKVPATPDAEPGAPAAPAQAPAPVPAPAPKAKAKAKPKPAEALPSADPFPKPN
jgi:hypothetical protein